MPRCDRQASFDERGESQRHLIQGFSVAVEKKRTAEDVFE